MMQKWRQNYLKLMVYIIVIFFSFFHFFLVMNIENANKATLKTKNKTKVTQSDYTCLVCFDNLADAVFLECGHGGICYKCAIDIWKSSGECFLCRKV